jgi:hypothetical protein
MSSVTPAPRSLAARLLPFTLSFALFGLGTAAAVVASLTEQNLNVYRAKFTAWLSLALATPAFCAFVLGLRPAARWSYWRWFWTFAYLAQLIHFHYAWRAFHFSVDDVYAEQGAVVATSNFVVIVWWGLDVLLAWAASRDNRVIQVERFFLTLLTFVSFFMSSVVFRVGTGRNLGIVMTVLIAGCLIFRLLDSIAGGDDDSTTRDPVIKGGRI